MIWHGGRPQKRSFGRDLGCGVPEGPDRAADSEQTERVVGVEFRKENWASNLSFATSCP